MDYYNTKKEILIEEIKRLKSENDILTASDNGFKILFEQTEKSILIINRKGKILNANKSALEHFRLKDIEKGLNMISDFLCDDGATLKDKIEHNKSRFKARVYIEGNPEEIICNIYKKNDNYILCLFSFPEKSSKDSLMLSSEYYRLLDSLDIGINLIGKDFRIKFTNKALLENKQNKINFLNRKCYEVYPHSRTDEPCPDCPVKKTFEDGGIHSKIIHSDLNADTTFDKVTASPVRDEKGEIIGAIEFIVNKNNNPNNRLYEENIFNTKNIINSLPTPVFIKDLKGKYILCNRNFAESIGKSENEIIGKSESDLFSESYAETFRKGDKTAIEKGFSEELIENITSENINGNNSFIIKKIPYSVDGKLIGIVGNIIDITEIKESRNQLSEQKSYLSNIIENANIMIIVLDLNGKITLFNKMAETITGYSREEVLGKNYFEYFVPKDKYPKVYESFLNFSKSKIVKYDNYENYIRTKSGEERYISWRDSANIYDNKVTGMISFGIDMSSAKTAEDAVVKLTYAFEQTSSAILLADKNGIVKYTNPAFTKITGYTAEDVKNGGKDFFSSIFPDEIIVKSIRDKIDSGESWYDEIQNKRKNGETYWESNSVSPVKNDFGQLIGYIVIKNDISDYKISYSNLKAQKEKSDEYARLMNLVTSNFSREFTTPLINILGYTEILGNEMNDKWHIEMIEDINRSGKRLLRSISLISKLSNLESGNISVSFQKCNLIKIINDVLPEFSDRISNKDVELIFKENDGRELFIESDLLIVKEIIGNLLENSIRFTDKGFIKVETGRVAEDGKYYALLSINDSGSGFTDNKHDINKTNNSVHITNEDKGFIVNISSYMAKLLNGSLTVNYDKNSGTNYMFKIPLSQDDEFYSEYGNISEDKSDSNVKSSAIKNPGKQKILLVEDNIANLNIIEIFLHDLYEIDSATTGEEAIIKSGITKYNLIIMDISLGSGLNGISTLKEIRKNKEYVDTPVLAVTGFALSDDRDNIMRAGFNEYLAKPFTRKQLLYMVKKLL